MVVKDLQWQECGLFSGVFKVEQQVVTLSKLCLASTHIRNMMRVL